MTGFEWQFWATAFGASLLRLMTSPYHSLTRALLTVAIAVFCAWVFTDAAVDLLDLNPERYRVPVAAVIALTGESLARFALSLVNDPFAALRKWRGRE